MPIRNKTMKQSRRGTAKGKTALRFAEAKKTLTTSVPSKSLTTAQKTEVARLVGRQIETRYAAYTTTLNQVIPAVPTLGGTSTLMVPVFQGSGISDRRSGDKMSPTRMTNRFHFYFDQAFSTSVDITIVLYILTSKKCKNYLNLASDPALSAGRFLNNGTGGPAVVWDSANPLVSTSQPVEATDVSILKKKTFRLIRNVGLDNLDATPGNAPNMKQSVAHYTYRHKKIPVLKYDGGASVPNNYAPFYYVVAYRSDGAGPIANTLLPNMTIHSDIYFKDA